MPAGSKAPFTRRIRSIAIGGAVAMSSSRFSWPMPCSAEIEPLKERTTSWTALFIGL